MDFDNESLLRCFLEEEDEKELIDWCKEINAKRSDIFEFRLEKADELREIGNEHFKKAEYETARKHYYGAIHQLDFDVGQQWNLMDNHQRDLNTRKLKVISNVCAAFLKERDFANTKKAADVGLRHMEKAALEDGEAKAKFLYRKGISNLERGFSEDAYRDLKSAEVASPGDKQIRDALLKASKDQKVDREVAKEVWKKKLLTEEEKQCMGPALSPTTLWARLRAKCKRCCRRKTD